MTMTKSKPNITILGIGNTLYSDEGVGVHVLPLLQEALSQHEHVEIIEGATDGIKLLGPVEDTDHLIIIDAINGQKQPGDIYTIDSEGIPAYFGIKMSIHQVGFQEVLFAAKIRERLPSHMVMFGLQPASLDFHVGLSETIENKLPTLVQHIVHQVNDWTDAYGQKTLLEGITN